MPRRSADPGEETSLALDDLRRLNLEDPQGAERYAWQLSPDALVTLDYAPETPAHAVHVYGRLVRRGRADLGLRDRLAGCGAWFRDHGTAADLQEFCLFLFSEKHWDELAATLPRCLRVLAAHDLADQLGIMADLAYLTAYRLRLRGQDPMAAALDRARRGLDGALRPPQRELFRACDAFLAAPLGRDRRGLVDAAAAWRAHFALGGLGSLLPAEALAQEPPFDPAVEIRQRAASARVVLVSTDRRYFDRFAQRFAASVAARGRGVAVHMHCIGFEPPSDAGLSGCGFSSEPIPPHLAGPEVPERYRRMYFASGRFLVLERLLQHYEHVWVTDIDGAVTARIAELPPASVNVHTPVGRNLGTRLPMEMVSAARISLRGDADGRAFARYLRRYLRIGLGAADGPVAFLDQCALFCGWQDLRNALDLCTDLPSFYSQTGNWSLSEGHAMKDQVFAG